MTRRSAEDISARPFRCPLDFALTFGIFAGIHLGNGALLFLHAYLP